MRRKRKAAWRRTHRRRCFMDLLRSSTPCRALLKASTTCFMRALQLGGGTLGLRQLGLFGEGMDSTSGLNKIMSQSRVQSRSPKLGQEDDFDYGY